MARGGPTGRQEGREVTLMNCIVQKAQSWQIRKAAALESGPPSGACSDEIIFLINLDNSLLIYESVCTNRELFFSFGLLSILSREGNLGLGGSLQLPSCLVPWIFLGTKLSTNIDQMLEGMRNIEI